MSGEYENFKERVRDAADIVEVISSYVPLKKRGQNYWGCCPFHGDVAYNVEQKKIVAQ
jgi:DNA primase